MEKKLNEDELIQQQIKQEKVADIKCDEYRNMGIVNSKFIIEVTEELKKAIKNKYSNLLTALGYEKKKRNAIICAIITGLIALISLIPQQAPVSQMSAMNLISFLIPFIGTASSVWYAKRSNSKMKQCESDAKKFERDANDLSNVLSLVNGYGMDLSYCSNQRDRDLESIRIHKLADVYRSKYPNTQHAEVRDVTRDVPRGSGYGRPNIVAGQYGSDIKII